MRLLRVDHGVYERREGRFQRLAREPVEPSERRGRLQAVERERAQAVPELRHRCRGLDALADDVSDDEPEPAVRQRDGVEPVAADVELRGAGQVASRKLRALDARERRGQHASLERHSDRLLGLEVRRAIECLRRLAGERLDEPALVQGHGVQLVPGHDEEPVRAPADDQRDEQERDVRGVRERPRELRELRGDLRRGGVEGRGPPPDRTIPRRGVVERDLEPRPHDRVSVAAPRKRLHELALLGDDRDRDSRGADGFRELLHGHLGDLRAGESVRERGRHALEALRPPPQELLLVEEPAALERLRALRDDRLEPPALAVAQHARRPEQEL